MFDGIKSMVFLVKIKTIRSRQCPKEKFFLDARQFQSFVINFLINFLQKPWYSRKEMRLERLDVATIATKITEIYPDTRPILREDILRTYEAVFDWRGGVIIMVLSGVLFAFVILAWDKATGLSAEEKREIGILKAVGWETSDILLMKFWEGAAVSLASFFIGIVLAYLHIFVGSAILFEPVLKGWSVLYPNFRLTPYISVYQISTLFFLTVIPYTVVTIIPSWRSATIDPDSVMRL